MRLKSGILFIVACIAILFVTGCSKKDSGDSVISGGSSEGSLTNHEGANEVVTANNVEIVTKKINDMAMDVYSRAILTPSFDKPSNFTTNLNGDIDGNKSGKVSIKGSVVTKMTGIITSGVDYNIVSIFYDFSDDGEMYYGGSLTYNGAVKYNTNNDFVSNTITFNGGFRFNGAYSGTEDIRTTVRVDSEGNYSYDVSANVTSGGVSFSKSFKY